MPKVTSNDTYYEFHNLYPCPLYIAVGKDWHNDDFDDDCNNSLEEEEAAVTYATHTKEKEFCVLIRFSNKKSIATQSIVAHEALHAVLFIMEYIGLNVNTITSEACCYLMEWVVNCVVKVKKGEI